MAIASFTINRGFLHEFNQTVFNKANELGVTVGELLNRKTQAMSYERFKLMKYFKENYWMKRISSREVVITATPNEERLGPDVIAQILGCDRSTVVMNLSKRS